MSRAALAPKTAGKLRLWNAVLGVKLGKNRQTQLVVIGTLAPSAQHDGTGAHGGRHIIKLRAAGDGRYTLRHCKQIPERWRDWAEVVARAIPVAVGQPVSLKRRT